MSGRLGFKQFLDDYEIFRLEQRCILESARDIDGFR
jgi:hypothetical protein